LGSERGENRRDVIAYAIDRYTVSTREIALLHVKQLVCITDVKLVIGATLEEICQ